MKKTGLLSFPFTCLLAIAPCLLAQGSGSPATQIPVIRTGVLHGATTLLTIAYDRNGKALNSISTTLSITLHSGDYPKLLKGGIHYNQKLDVPLQAEWLRAGIFDPASGRVGSLEVPFTVKPTIH